MTEENKPIIYKVEDIFEEIPDDLENVNMKIPEEVAEKAGMKPGDKIRVLWGDQGTIIIEKVEDNDKKE